MKYVILLLVAFCSLLPMQQLFATVYTAGSGAMVQRNCQGDAQFTVPASYKGGNDALASISCAEVIIFDFSNLDHAYDNTPKSPVVTTTPEGLDIAVTYNASTTQPSAAGTYMVVATAGISGFYYSDSAVMTITDTRVFETTTTVKVYTDETNAAATQTVSPLKVAYVKLNSPSTGTELGTSWDKAFPALQDALAYAATQPAGVEVRVAAGTHKGSFAVPANTQLVGGYAAASTGKGGTQNAKDNLTILDGNNTQRVVKQIGANTISTRIEGFTIQNGLAADSAAGVMMNVNGLLDNCIITANSAPNGAGVVLKANSRMVNATVHNNTASVNGSGLMALSGASVTFSTIRDNKGASAVWNAGRLSHVMVYNNQAGGIVNNNATAVVKYTTVADNTGVGIVNTLGNVQYTISWNNTTNTSGTGFVNCNGNNDPLFFGGSDKNKAYQLAENSPCIDGGEVSATGIDFIGNARVFSTKTDIGAYEHYYCSAQNATLSESNRPKENTAVISVAKNSVLSVNLSTPVSVDRIVLHSDDNATAMLIDNDGYMQAADVVLQKTMSTDKWYLLALPYNVNLTTGITNVNNVALTVGAGNDIDIRSYDGYARAQYNKNYETNSPYWTAVSGQLKANEGYLMALKAGQTIKIHAASAYKEPATVPSVTLNANNVKSGTYSTDKENMGWNLRGIPFMSAYDMNKIDKSMIVYTYTGTTWKAVEAWKETLLLPAFSGYFIQTSTLKETEQVAFAHQGKSTAAISNRIANAAINAELELDLEITGAGYTDETKVRIDEYASMNYEPNKDALKIMSLNPEVPQIYSAGPGGYGYAINVRPEQNKVIPLNVTVGKASNYTINVGKTAYFGNYDNVYLVDKLLNQRIDLKSDSYEFTATEAFVYDNRFEIVLNTSSVEPEQPVTPDAPETGECPDVKVYFNTGIIHLENITLPATIALYDVQGNTIVSRRAYFENDFIEMNNNNGVFILKITTPCKSQLLKFMR